MNERKKVLFLITKATWGGAQRYVYDLARSLPQNEFQPALAYGVEGRLSELLRNEAIRARQIPALARDIALVNDVRSFYQILTMLKNAQPEVLHLNSSKAAALGALAGRIARVPNVVFTAHGWPFKESRNPLSRAVIYFICWLTACMSHHVIVVSHADEALGKRMWGVKKKIVFVPLGIDAPHFRNPDDAYRAMFGALTPAPLTPKTLRLVSIAELTKNKGVRYAIDALALLKSRGIDAIYCVAGIGEERASLERRAHEQGIDDSVFFAGFIEHAAVNLTGFDIFLLPSLKEGTPYVLLEAAAAGLPIVATDAVDEALVNDIDNFVMVPAHDTLALADAIEASSKRARSSAPREISTIPAMVQHTLEIYRSERGST